METENMLIDIATLKSSIKTANHRIDKLDEKVEDIHNLTLAVSTVNQKVDTLSTDLNEIKDDVKKVSDRPKMWWDKLVAAALGAVAAGIVAAILATVLK